jgi:hypothetical protein
MTTIEGALRECMLAGRTAAMTALECGFAAASSAPAERTKPATSRARDVSSTGRRRTAGELDVRHFAPQQVSHKAERQRHQTRLAARGGIGHATDRSPFMTRR